MSTGLLALLDDVAAIVKITAASLDDIATQTGAAGSKAAGMVIDDAAVTPKYVVGLSPSRELPIIWNIAKGSIKNKLVYLMPLALLLGWTAAWSIKPLLGFGGIYLCFEGYEKIHDLRHRIMHKNPPENARKELDNILSITAEEFEKQRTKSAIRTDLILSAEIMSISYAVVAQAQIMTQIITLVFVALGITAGVYGFVAFLVKVDDIGLYLAKNGQFSFVKMLGRGMIRAMPSFLKLLGGIGTAAMLWVGGGIIIHSVPVMHHGMEHMLHALRVGSWTQWGIGALMSAVFGGIVGLIAERIVRAASPVMAAMREKIILRFFS